MKTETMRSSRQPRPAPCAPQTKIAGSSAGALRAPLRPVNFARGPLGASATARRVGAAVGGTRER